MISTTTLVCFWLTAAVATATTTTDLEAVAVNGQGDADLEGFDGGSDGGRNAAAITDILASLDLDTQTTEDAVSIDDLDGGGGSKIVNGSLARRGQFPFMVGLAGRKSRRPFCGASLITNK